MRRLLLFFILLVNISFCVNAQKISEIDQSPNTPRISVTNLQKTETPVAISDITIDVKVVGSLAVTTVDMLVSNPNNRILEGQLEFPLGEGQTVSRLALDINGKLREGVTIEKAKGQAVFESVVRRNVDPALLEKTVGNNFKLRLYPLPANGTRRVVISYEQELIKKENAYRFFLPIEYGSVLKNFTLNLKVLGSSTTPQVDKTPWGNFAFDKAGDTYIASYAAKNFKAKGQLVFSVPIKQAVNTYIEKEKVGNDFVFYSKIYPKIETTKKSQPKSIDIYWDASGSMSKRNIVLELELLNKYFSSLKNVTVNLYTFNVRLSKPQKFEVINGNWSDLKAILKNQKYDGATQYNLINLKKSIADEILLFSDGISNFGKGRIAISTQPIISVNSSLIQDDSYAKYLALASGGKYINLLNQTTDEALTSLLNSNYRLISIDYNQNQVKDITTSTLEIKPETGFFITGKLLSNKATLTVKFGVGNQVTDVQKIELDLSNTANYDNIVEHIYAAKRIEELDFNYDQNKSKILRLGKLYNIVTRNTSLIVLDNVSDYLQYDITPPQDLLAEYEKLKKEQKGKKEYARQDRTDFLLSLLDTRKEWWNTKFEYKPKINNGQKGSLVNSQGNIRGKVLDSDGESIVGASVIIKNANRGVYTNINGEFNIDAAIGDVLIFSLMGYDNKEVSVTGTSFSNIVLNQSNQVLNENVVTVLPANTSPPPPPPLETPMPELSEFGDPILYESDEIISETKNIELHVAGADVSKIKDAVQSDMFSSPNKRTIILKGWKPNTPYLKVLEDTSDKELYSTYLSVREEYATTPSFYLDVASIMEDRGMKDEAFLVLSNIAELDLQNYKLIRVLAHRLQQLGYIDFALDLFEKVLELRLEEPQSYRDLALANEQAKNYQKTIDLYNEALYINWDERFSEVEIILLEEMNHAIQKAKENNINVDLSMIDKKFIYDTALDIRVVLNWDTDNSDMDLWVTNPNGEKCYYMNSKTAIGGIISKDFTDGYGPEEFLLKKAIKGLYNIEANYYSTREQTLEGPTTIYLDIFTNYGKRNENKQTIMLRLTKTEESVINIGQVKW